MGAALTRIAQAFISLILGAVVFPTAITAGVSSLPNRDGASGAPGAELPQVVVRPASSIKFPANTDCNSPAHWDGSTFYLFNSAPTPWRSSGPDLSHLGAASETHYDKETNGGRWIESTWKADDGTLYGWYHNEPHPVCPSRPDLTAPRIGAARSKDHGAHWEDLGLILAAPPYPLRCDTEDRFFAGGNGDFSVIPDEKREYFYFFISTYHAQDPSEQGIAAARIRYADRNDPVGKVWKWYQGWGPSIHWNTHLSMYVILTNRAIDRNWTQGGIYVSFNRSLTNPSGWTEPKKILERKDCRGRSREDTRLVPSGDRN